MKKIEAMQLSQERSRLLIEYINQVLSDEKVVDAKIIIGSNKIEKENIKTFDIYVPIRNFEKHLNTSITSQHENVLSSQILDDLIINYLNSKTIKLSRIYRIRGTFDDFTGINITSCNGTKISIDFGYIDRDIEENYNCKLEEYDTLNHGFKI